MDYTILVKEVVNNLGGKENITKAFHCISRLRFECKDRDKVNLKAIETIKGVMGVNVTEDQIQVIIGSDVNKCYQALLKAYPSLAGEEEKALLKKGSNPLMASIKVVAEVFGSFVPALAGAGMIKALVSVIQIFSLMSTDSSSYIILNAMGDGLFYFLPFFIAVSAAKRFKMSPYVAIAIIAAIQHPSITALLGGGEAVSFFGLPVASISYSSTMIHPLIAIFIASWIYKFTENHVPAIIRLFASPMLVILITVPLTLIVIGPIAQQIAVWIGQLTELILNTGIIGGAILGFAWPAIVFTGMHGTTYPITVSNMTTLGYDLLWPIKMLTNMANCGAAFGVALRTKNKKLRGVAISTGATAFIGICEPSMFGVNARLGRPFVAVMIGNAVGGAIMGLFHVAAYILPTTGGIFSIPYFIGPTFGFGMLAIAATILTSFAMTIILGFTDDPIKADTADALPVAFIRK